MAENSENNTTNGIPDGKQPEKTPRLPAGRRVLLETYGWPLATVQTHDGRADWCGCWGVIDHRVSF